MGMTEDLSSSCVSEPYFSLVVSLLASPYFAKTLIPAPETVPLSIFSLVAAVLELSISFGLVCLVGAVFAASAASRLFCRSIRGSSKKWKSL
jgi:hypothetical protein